VVKPGRGAQVNALHPLARGLVGCWPLNENYGGVYDIGGHGYNGTLSANAFWAPGRDGPMVGFPGSSDEKVTVAKPTVAKPLTFVAWVRTGASGTIWGLSIGRNNASRYAWGCGCTVGSSFFYYWRNNSTAHQTTWGTAAANTDYMIAGTSDGAYHRLYVNGQLVDSDADGGQDIVTQNVAYIGREATDDARTAAGYAGLQLLYNRALSAEEIARLYREPYAMVEWPRMGWMYVAGGAPPAVNLAVAEATAAAYGLTASAPGAASLAVAAASAGAPGLTPGSVGAVTAAVAAATAGAYALTAGAPPAVAAALAQAIAAGQPLAADAPAAVSAQVAQAVAAAYGLTPAEVGTVAAAVAEATAAAWPLVVDGLSATELAVAEAVASAHGLRVTSTVTGRYPARFRLLVYPAGPRVIHSGGS
jgi:hypothetical protein